MYGPDYSQAEARIVAYESRDLEYIRIFEEGRDIHTENASTIFEREIDPSIPQDYELRQLGKKVCHGLNYLMGPQTLCDSIIKELGPKYAITQKQAKQFGGVYFERFKGVKNWHHDIFEELKATRTLTNCFGRKRTFLGRIDEKMHRIGVAFKPQSTVADLCNRAIRRVYEEFGAKFREDGTMELGEQIEFLLQIHDSLLWQLPDTVDIKATGERIVKAMTIPCHIHGMNVIIPIDNCYGHNWGELEKIK